MVYQDQRDVQRLFRHHQRQHRFLHLQPSWKPNEVDVRSNRSLALACRRSWSHPPRCGHTQASAIVINLLTGEKMSYPNLL